MFRKILLTALATSVVLCFNASAKNAGNLHPSPESVLCASPGKPREAMKKSDAVFLGKIMEITAKDNLKTIKFQVERFWKGAKAKTQTVLVATSIRYNPSFSVGDKYIVYAWKNQNGQLMTGRCSRTKLAEYADDDLKELGTGGKP